MDLKNFKLCKYFVFCLVLLFFCFFKSLWWFIQVPLTAACALVTVAVLGLYFWISSWRDCKCRELIWVSLLPSLDDFLNSSCSEQHYKCILIVAPDRMFSLKCWEIWTVNITQKSTFSCFHPGLIIGALVGFFISEQNMNTFFSLTDFKELYAKFSL